MAVEVNWKRLKATHRELGGEGELIVHLLPEQGTTAEVLDQALVDDPYPVDEGPANGGWFPGPKGWLLLLETDVDQTLWDWIGLLAQRLTSLGISGTLTGARHAGRVNWAMDIQSQAYLSGLLAYQPHPSTTMYPSGWGADPAVLDTALHHTMAWAMADADLAHVSMGSISIGVPPPQALPLTRTQIIGNYNALATGYAKKRTRVRNLTLESPTALGMSQHNQEPEARAAMVADLRNQILTAPRDTLTLARVDLDDWSTLRSASSEWRLGHDATAFGLYPDLWGEWSPDPCGIQILTSRHLAKAHDLSDWTLTQLDTDHWLVEAPDLTPWYHTYGPYGRYRVNPPCFYYPPDLIYKARHDFGDMILTHDKAHDLGLTTRPIPR